MDHTLPLPLFTTSTGFVYLSSNGESGPNSLCVSLSPVVCSALTVDEIPPGSQLPYLKCDL